jgi:inosose dehydratase
MLMTAETSSSDATSSRRARLRLGSAPDSWGVWFPDEPRQIPWPRFLDEFVAAGYEWLELGPYGYLPTDPARLRDELDRRRLRLSGGGVAGGLHRSDAWDAVLAETRQIAQLTKDLGGTYLVFLPEMYRDDTGAFTGSAQLEADQWRNLVKGVSRLGELVAGDYGLELVFHNHADSHVGTQEQTERFLAETDPKTVSLCLDTGHLSYYGGDNLAVIRRFPERIGCLHIKQVDPAVLKRVGAEDLSFAQAVPLGVMCEPPHGVPEMEPVLDAVAALDRDLFAIVEQDLYPCDPGVPLPIATRTREYLGQCGLGPGPREG